MKKKSKNRKVEEVKIGRFPKFAEFPAWRNNLYQNVNTAADRSDDKALLWVKEVEEYDKVADEILAEAPRKSFQKLDKRISAAVQRAAHGQLGRQITQHVTLVLKEGRSARGRELLRMVFRYYLTNRTQEQVYRITDLQKVVMKDSKNGDLEKFINDWDWVWNNVMEDVPQSLAEQIFYEAIKSRVAIQTEIKYDERIDDEVPRNKDRCFDYLYTACQRYIARERKEKAQGQLRRNLRPRERQDSGSACAERQAAQGKAS